MKICPYCGKEIQGNHHTYANHVRWCKDNPKYKEIKESTIEKNSIKHNKKHIFNLKCVICGSEYSIYTTDYKYSIGKYKKTCCNECSKKLTSLNTNKEEKNDKIRKRILQNLINNGYYIQNNTFTAEYIIKSCAQCGKEFEVLKNHKRRKYCCGECKKLSYLNRYKQKKTSTIKVKAYKYINKCEYCKCEFETNRKEQKFCSISCARRNQIDDKTNLKKIYRQQCNFKFGLKDFPDLFDFNLLETYGIYKASNRGNNPNGVSRDHMISVNYGFKHNIDPYIISHPMNCSLMTQPDNFKKLDDCSISLTELIERINNFDKIYGIYPNKIDYSLLNDYNIIYKI